MAKVETTRLWGADATAAPATRQGTLSVTFGVGWPSRLSVAYLCDSSAFSRRADGCAHSGQRREQPPARGADRPTQAASEDPPEPLAPLENLIEQGQYQQAIPGLEHYLHDHDSSAKAHYDLGYAFFRTHEIGGAVRELSRSLQLNDKDAQAHKILGLGLHLCGSLRFGGSGIAGCGATGTEIA